ncbi:hypothetical protein PTTG_27167 [Puccinia triticina 1-1 BBBD Race 1]|uniref:Uncharacterized protein n=1 Tax=Puccinia triticina (isolate 1-1 / race 1 (BBBD)) TaxID=630390 RepID=A0A180GN13_PUCT1|nr:hypothetical protein PTTG_27167 [Puccinia triticina 1-1 BBBD Race 1]
MELIPEDPEISGLAATTQDMIKDIAGREETIRLCQEWIPRMELNEILERSMYHQGNSNKPQNTAAPPLHNNPARKFLTPDLRDWEGSYPSVQSRNSAAPPQQPPLQENMPYRGPQMPPPPAPPPSQPPLQVRQHPATIPQEVVQLFRHHPYQQPGGYNQQHQHPYPPTAHTYTDQYPPPPQGNWRGSERNWRRP